MMNNEAPHHSNISSRRSSWTQEDDELFEQLIQDLTIGDLENDENQQKGNQSLSGVDFGKIREELNSKFLEELSNKGNVAEQNQPLQKEELVSEKINDTLTNQNNNSSLVNLENNEEKIEKKEGIIYDSFREWLEANRKIIDLEKEEDELVLLELFIAHKERELLKKIVSFSDCDGSKEKKLFFRKNDAASINKIQNKESLVSEFSNDSYLLNNNGDSSDEEDNSKSFNPYIKDVLICNYTSGTTNGTTASTDKQKIITKSHRVYSTSKHIDKYHEGTNFYEHLKDIIVGGDLENGGSLRAVSQISNTKQKIETFFGIDMSEESWIHFKNYIRKIILDKNNLELKTDTGKNLTDSSEADYLKELYPISNEKNSAKVRWAEGNKSNISNTNIPGNKKRNALAKLKALKLLYGTTGYAESLLVDHFSPIYLLESGLFMDATLEERKTAIENEMRNLEIKLVNATNKEEFKWIENLVNYLKDSSKKMEPQNILEDLSEDQWKELEELVGDIGKRLEVYNTHSETPRVLEIPSDQFNIPKPQLVEEPVSKDILLENTYENANITVNSWKNGLSNTLDFGNNKNAYEEMKDVKKQIEEKGFSVKNSTPKIENRELSSLGALQKVTKSDTKWSNLDELTSLPITRLDSSLFKLKLPIFAPLTDKYKHLKNGILKSTIGFKFFGVSPSDGNKYDWTLGTKLNEDENAEVSPYSFKLGELYSYLVEKSHISTKYALMETRKIANLFFKTNSSTSTEKSPKSFSKKDHKQYYHELVREDSKHSALEENTFNNSFSFINEGKKSLQQKSEQNQKENTLIQTHVSENIMENNNSTTSTHYLSNTFSVDENVWKEGELIQLSKGLDVAKEINSIRNDCLNQSFNEFSKLANMPDNFNANKLFYPTMKTIEIQKNILPRVSEIQEQRFDKISLLHLEQTVVQIESNIATKSLSGIEPSEEEKKSLQTLKQKLEEERKRLENVIYTDTISPLEQSKLESLGIFQQSVKLLNIPAKQNKENTQDLLELERDLIIDREFRILDQLLDQMNREQRREVLSYKPNGTENSIIQLHQDAIKNYSKLRSYYNQMVRKDSSMKEWQSLTLKEKISFEKEFRKQSKIESYENVVNSVLRMMQSAQFAETFSFISTALSKKSIESKNYNTELAKLLLESYQKENNQIRVITRAFIQKNGIDQRYKTKLLSKHRKLDANEKKLREVYNYENYTQSIMVNQLDNSDPALQDKLLHDIFKNELTKDEVYSIVSHQHDIQKLFKKERLAIVKKFSKKSADNTNNIITVEESKEDPLFGIIQKSPLDYFTFGQLTYFQRLFEESMTKRLKEWREKSEQSATLLVSPHYLKDDNALQLDTTANEKGEYEKLTLKVFDINRSQLESDNMVNHPSTPVFPEVPWNGSFKDLQLLYLKMQLDRSNNPHYTRSVLEFNNSPERFLQRSFWKGVWMLPESLSNFVYTSDPFPIIKMLPPSQPKQVEKKHPPVFTPSQPPPIVTPIIPTIPIPTVQTPPPPITQNILPPQMPSIPRIQIPIQRPTVQPPTLPIIQPPSQPSIIPQRSPVLVNGTPIYPRYLLENLNRRLFQ
ncbi:predicted protein [Naegleria gruberi]|uniref:Predicted protein n=1 Tax=Naegleria gruberi TaxID=5762 RepID=D2UYK4_NAEGR|nr:uncharacterized protein NAEGRDRAFT_45199 [Naegleria gruberi]EFC50810.1 predicted protein [Naegleria gruberi]|eukprot:XP_002683554.1 predicted protein [Naegleria gruberi strain NEG-M]